MLAVAAVFCISSCSTEASKAIKTAQAAIEAAATSGNLDEAVAATDAAYQLKDQFTSSNYANTAVLYQLLFALYQNQLAQNPAAVDLTAVQTQLTYCQRIVELYEAGVAVDESMVNDVMKQNGIDNFAEIVEGYKTINIPQLEEYINNGGQPAATVEEGTEVVEGEEATAEEVTEETAEE